MKSLRITPYIRDDIAFQYFDLLFHSSLNEEFDTLDYWQILVPYVLQKTFDFSEWDYEEVKQKIGDGKLVEYIINSLVAEEGDYPRVADMVSKAKDYIEKIEREK